MVVREPDLNLVRRSLIVDSGLREPIVDRAFKRLGDVVVNDDSWQVIGRPELGDSFHLYTVRLDGEHYSCTCYGHDYGDSRQRQLCSHVIAVIAARRLGRAQVKPASQRLSLTPADLGMPAKFSEFRPAQTQALSRIQESDKKFIMLQAPTGSGKSLLAACLQRLLKTRVLYSCHTIQLQEQFISDFRRDLDDDSYAVELKGRQNYPTLRYPKFFPRIHCGLCLGKQETHCRWCCDGNCGVEGEVCARKPLCPYRRQKAWALASNLAVVNMALLLVETNYVGGFSGWPWLVLDEACLLESQLMSFVSLDITKHWIDRLGIEPPSRKTVQEAWVDWARSEAVPAVTRELAGLQNEYGVENIRQQQELERMLAKLSFFLEEVAQPGRWVFMPAEDRWTFKPVFVSKYAGRYLWAHAGRFLLMSATIISVDEMCYSLGIPKQEVEFIDLPSCVSEDTEILTQDGWKKYTEIKVGDKVATLKVEPYRSHELRYQPILELYVAPYAGKMVSIRSQSQDQLVTPNHRVLMHNRQSGGCSGKTRKWFRPSFVEAKDFGNKGHHKIRIPMAAKIGYRVKRSANEDLLKVLAWIITEGSERSYYSNGQKKLCGYDIAQSITTNSKYVAEIREALKVSGLQFTERSSQSLYKGSPYYMARFHIKAENARNVVRPLLPETHRIPRWAFRLKRENLLVLYSTLMKGDGSQLTQGGWEKNSYLSHSFGLASDVQELALKLGYRAVLRRKGERCSVNINRKLPFAAPTAFDVSNIDYSGIVWCPRTPDGTWVARRNGMPFITGNTFDPKRRPIYYLPSANVTKRTEVEERPKAIAALDKILDENPEVKVLVHTKSYGYARQVVSMSRHKKRMITYDRAKDRSVKLEEFKRASPGAVLVASSMDRGVSLDGDWCRIVVIMKVPYGDLGDKQISARLYSDKKGGRLWYIVNTVRDLVQQSGRHVRSQEDFGDTYILDSQFERLFRENKTLFPTWWRAALHGMPDPGRNPGKEAIREKKVVAPTADGQSGEQVG